jgi:hypothetical protein
MGPMKYRKLRIAWSVVWGIAAAMLVVVWVRSYWRVDWVWHTTSQRITNIRSDLGGLSVGTHSSSSGTPGWAYDSSSNMPLNVMSTFDTGPVDIRFPYWVAVLLTIGISSASWATSVRGIKRSFSLRTMLIATTLVAVGLGLIVWAVK